MVNEQVLQGHWNEIKGKLREKWGQLTNDDLERFSGDVDMLAGLIQRKTGAARSAVEEYLEQITENGTSAVGRAAESVRQGVQHAVESVEDTSEEAWDYARERYEDAREMVRERPSESVIVCFGVGLVAGLLVGLLVKRS
jgi:uncharacterized protein YjbJ (UPF0337 family)